LVSDTAIAPTLTVATPAAFIPPATATLTMAPGSPVTFSGTATDDEGLDYVAISLRNTATGENLSAGGVWGIDQIAGSHRISGDQSLPGTTYNWTYTTPFNLSSGTYSFSVGAVDDLGLSTGNSGQGRITINVQVPGDAFPNGTVTPSGTVTGVQVLHLDLAGTATDDIGVSAVRVALEESDSGRFLQPNGTLAATYAYLTATLTPPGEPGVTAVNWTLPVNLPTQGDWRVSVIAIDSSQQQDPSVATSRYQIFPGDQPPTVTEALLQPTDGAALTGGKIFVSGRLEDDQQIAEGHVAVRNGAGQYMNSSGQFTSTSASWRNAFLNSPGSPGSNFSYTTPTIPSGSYTVLVRGEDQHGFVTAVPSQRVVTVTNTTVNLPPVADFTYTCTQNVCVFDGRTSTDEATPTLTYSWSFGQGSGSGPLPTRTYTAAGSYTVTLTVRDENNLTNQTSKVVSIVEPAANVAPSAVIASAQCTARTCVFSSSGTADTNIGDSVSLLWSFGDTPATTSTSSNPSKAYAADGTYAVTLTATDGWGKSTTATTSVTIAMPVGNAAPTAAITGPACVGKTCNFFSTTSTDPNNDTFTYLWNFGDGTTNTTANPSKTYVNLGTYTVTLTLTDVWGNVSTPATTTRTIAVPGGNLPPIANIVEPVSCVAKTCSLSSAGSSDPNGDTFTYSWNFGDATTAGTTSAPSHAFAGVGPYTVVLTLTDVWGVTATDTVTISFTEPPTNTAPNAVIDTPVCTARACTFSAVTSTDPQGDAFTYAWTFADTVPTASTSAQPTKTWAADGTYTVTLTLTDVWGKVSNVATRDVTIARPATNTAPTPVISPPVCNGRSCIFPGVSSSDAQGDAFTYLWTFPDLTTSTSATTAAKTFVDGTYTITLKVTDAWGDFATTTRDFIIAEPGDNVAPTAVMAVPSCTGRVCTFSSAASFDPNGNTFTYAWVWGDATANGTTANPSHTYAAAGTYNVTLTLTDVWGKVSNVATRTVTVV
jgi:PKD repeat protein